MKFSVFSSIFSHALTFNKTGFSFNEADKSASFPGRNNTVIKLCNSKRGKSLKEKARDSNEIPKVKVYPHHSVCFENVRKHYGLKSTKLAVVANIVSISRQLELGYSITINTLLINYPLRISSSTTTRQGYTTFPRNAESGYECINASEYPVLSLLMALRQIKH